MKNPVDFKVMQQDKTLLQVYYSIPPQSGVTPEAISKLGLHDCAVEL